MVKSYSSFEEIDTRLKILELQREIDQESLKLNVQNARVDLVPRLFRNSLGTNFSQNDTLKSLFITFISSKALNFIRKKRRSRSRD
ncbi:hypothetical protein SAMN04488008_101133 [Maribacter orientalis]|uniref:Uncharacterized protein n=1 Tax=Maribacter orientalis TaxID=228957 RepID=A0A1H7FHG1_9FLAO|nr:DUF6327 family protein [Maribacter orientalis]SEK24687.1 hypothetical protein SAMN04488008_101133 [Maribacter orientalis]